MANKSNTGQTTPVPESVDDVIQFFLLWKFCHDNKTIDSARLKKCLGSQLDTFHDILTEIHRDDEPMGRDEADVNRLNKVIDFLDELAK